METPDNTCQRVLEDVQNANTLEKVQLRDGLNMWLQMLQPDYEGHVYNSFDRINSDRRIIVNAALTEYTDDFAVLKENLIDPLYIKLQGKLIKRRYGIDYKDWISDNSLG